MLGPALRRPAAAVLPASLCNCQRLTAPAAPSSDPVLGRRCRDYVAQSGRPEGWKRQRSGSVVQVSKQRHEALIESEIVHFARAVPPHPITLQQILGHCDADSLREFLLEELPIRYARRLALIESLEGWNNFPQMRVIRSIYSDAFRRLRMLSQKDADAFRKQLANIKHKHANMLMLVIKGTRAMKNTGAIPDERVDEFLDSFLTARIGTDILCSQYLAITRPGGATSVIDAQCDPVGVVRAAAADAVRLCKYHYNGAPPVDVVDVAKVRFPFIPQYLNYIMFELVKNSLRAVVERYDSDKLPEHPVVVTVCGDDTAVVIRVSDAGGGIPLDMLPRVWSYLYTTARCVSENLGESMDEAPDPDSDSEAVSPMAGFGCGLPLSRTYASYVGGRLELNSMPHHGADAYLYLNRIGNAQEIVDKGSLPSRGYLTPDAAI